MPVEELYELELLFITGGGGGRGGDMHRLNGTAM